MHRAGEQLPERTVVPVVRTLHREQVLRSVLLQDHDGWVAEPHEQQVLEPSASSPLPSMNGWMHSNSLWMAASSSGHGRAVWRECRTSARSLTLWTQPSSWDGTSGHDGGVMPPSKGWMSCSRRLPGDSRSDASGCGETPHTRRHRHRVDSADLVHAHQVAFLPVRGFERLAVDPLGRLAVALDLHVLLEGFGAHGTALLQQGLDFAEDESVAFEGCGVVRLQMPDVRPDELGLVGREDRQGGCSTPRPRLAARVDRVA